MANFGFDLFTGLSSIVIITMLLTAVKANDLKIPVPGSVMGKAWNALSSLATFFSDHLSYNPFLYVLFSENKRHHRRGHDILRRRISADHALVCLSDHQGSKLQFKIY